MLRLEGDCRTDTLKDSGVSLSDPYSSRTIADHPLCRKEQVTTTAAVTAPANIITQIISITN